MEDAAAPAAVLVLPSPAMPLEEATQPRQPARPTQSTARHRPSRRTLTPEEEEVEEGTAAVPQVQATTTAAVVGGTVVVPPAASQAPKQDVMVPHPRLGMGMNEGFRRRLLLRSRRTTTPAGTGTVAALLLLLLEATTTAMAGVEEEAVEVGVVPLPITDEAPAARLVRERGREEGGVFRMLFFVCPRSLKTFCCCCVVCKQAGRLLSITKPMTKDNSSSGATRFFLSQQQAALSTGALLSCFFLPVLIHPPTHPTGEAMSPQRASGLQKEVLGLYRQLLRAARQKDPSKEAGGTWALARAQFREDAASVKRSDFQKIEFLLRHGRKQLKYLSMPGFSRAQSVTPDR